MTATVPIYNLLPFKFLLLFCCVQFYGSEGSPLYDIVVPKVVLSPGFIARLL